MDFVNTPHRQKYWYFSKPYLTLPLHLIIRQDKKITTNLKQYGQLKLAVVAYYAALEIIENDYPNVTLVLVSSNQEGLKKVAFGEVDGFISDLPVASYWANSAGIVSLKNMGKLPYSYNISFATSRKLPLLHSIIEKSLATISSDTRLEIQARWLIGPFAIKPLLSSPLQWLMLIFAPLLAFAAAWSIWRIFRQNKRLAKHQHALKLLTQKQLGQTQHEKSQNFDKLCHQITQVATETLQVERASVLLFDDAKTQLECKSLYLKSLLKLSNIKPLQAVDLPIYFNAIQASRVIAVNDANINPITTEFTHGYLHDNHIGALLDATIRVNNETVGVVCLEHTNGSRKWTLDEQSFAASLADLCNISLETSQRFAAEQALIALNENLEQEVVARAFSLVESEKRYNYVLQHAPIPILILTKHGVIIEVNPEAEAAIGLPKEAIMGKNFVQTVVAKESQKTAVRMAAKSLKGEAFRNVELKLQNANGVNLEYVCSIGMLTETDTEDGQMVAIAQDISQQKLLQYSLNKAREAAESADRIKSMFVASMSHELRTPLNSIIGFLGVVLQGMSGELNVKQKDQLGRAYNSSKHLLSLITDVIDISKIEAGFLQVHVEKFDFATLLVEVQHAVQHLAQDKKLYLKIDCAVDVTLETDRKRLYQVILNVASNALKYSEEGGVKIVVNVRGKNLFITIEDTGIGIGEAGLAKLFQPFERVESHLKIKTLGTGLGLYLTKKILSQLLGGEISVKSQLGVGSMFTIKVPIKLPTVAAQNHLSVLEDSAP